LRYQKFFSHYTEYTVALALLSFLGLYLALETWEETFVPQFRSVGAEPGSYKIYEFLAEQMHGLILISTLVCILFCYQKYRTKHVYMENADPLILYKKLMIEQSKIGLIDQDSISENFVNYNGSFRGVIADKLFWFEVFLLLLIPYPTGVLGFGTG